MNTITIQADPRPGRVQASRAHRFLESMLAQADIRLDGQRPWDLNQVRAGAAERILAAANLGLGETYMDGLWDCEALDAFFDHLFRSGLSEHLRPLTVLAHHLRARWLNLQRVERAAQVAHVHYDLGNDFYAAMLDRRMTYTCAFWQSGATNLDMAQEHKLDLVCRKLELQPGMRVLDIGCGWGSFMKFAAQRYGVHCVGVTISAEQVHLGRILCAGLPVEFRQMDYRALNEPFDRIVSLGMFEHVGHKNYQHFMNIVRSCLQPDGLFLLHTIGRNAHGYGSDPWISRYIFPNGELPTIAQIGRATENLFLAEDLHNFGADYDRTLLQWHANFERSWSHFSARYGERFRRMWRYYLLSSAGAFRARDIQLWQWVLAPPGRAGVYARVAR